MIIYCAGPIRGDIEYQSYYKQIIDYVHSLGHTALSELNSGFKSALPLSDNQIFTRDIKWIEKSRLVIAEVSGASLGVGFEIAYALYKLKIPVLALANEKSEKVSALIVGCDSPLITVKVYSGVDNMQKIIADFIDKLSKT
jgi:hypothetical protein